MPFNRLQQYRERFFQTNWQANYPNENPAFLGEIKKRADYLLNDEIVFTDALDMEPLAVPFSIAEYKWNDYPLSDPEWTFMLSRQGFLVDLAITYYFTNDEQYLAKYLELVFDFIKENGVPNEENRLSWRPLDTGIRLTNLMKSFTYIEVESVLSDKQLLVLKESIQIHVDYLETSYIEKYDLSNWGVLAVTGMAAVELYFPELVDSNKHDFIWSKIQTQIELKFYEDGIHWEQSPLYHHQVITAFLYLVQVSSYLDELLSVDLSVALQQPIIAAHYYANEIDLLNPLHDSDNVDFSYIYDLYRYMGYLKDKLKSTSAILFVGSLYDQNRPNTTERYPELFYSIDSGFHAYKNEEMYFTLFNGLHGSSHGHATNGSFTLDVENEPFIVDPGRYTYTEDALRLYLKEEQAHNTVTIKNQPATTIEGSWDYSSLAEPIFDKVRETTVGPLFEIGWTGRNDESLYIINRTVLYIKDSQTYVFYDRVESSGFVEIETHFQLDPALTVTHQLDHELGLGRNDISGKIWVNKGQLTLSEKELSKIYNEKLAHQRVTNTVKTEEPVTGMVTVLTLNDAVEVRNIPAYQNNKEGLTDYIEAIQIRNGSETLDLYFLNRDVVKGDKLFKTKDHQSFYGQINIVNEKGILNRLK